TVAVSLRRSGVLHEPGRTDSAIASRSQCLSRWAPLEPFAENESGARNSPSLTTMAEKYTAFALPRAWALVASITVATGISALGVAACGGSSGATNGDG